MQTIPWVQHQHGVLGQVHQRRTQAAGGAVNQKYPRMLESTHNAKLDQMMSKDDLLHLNSSNQSTKHEQVQRLQSNQQSYYVQMLKNTHIGPHSKTAMADHLSDKMLKRGGGV